MKLGLFSDVHSNLAALEAVLRFYDEMRVDRLICLGDIVGYGPQPNESIELVRRHCDLVLLGNHDSMAIARGEGLQVNGYAEQAIRWTRTILTDQNREWLSSLPFLHSEYGARYVHANPKSPADWGYVGRLDEAAESFRYFDESLCFLGHTHRPLMVVQKEDSLIEKREATHYLRQQGERMLINVGSVGQPRDGDPRAAAVVWEEESVALFRVAYAVSETQKRMKKVGLPPFLINRLETGS